jgi:quercetin dioxygenase-like cupin family protein
MNSMPHDHGPEGPDALWLYALRALPADEHAAVDAHIATCAACHQEVERLRPTVDAFIGWPGDDLRPSATVWDRLAERVAAETGERPALPAPREWADAAWKEVGPGISCKLLATDTEQSRVSMLVRLAPGTEYPPHRHAGIEELYMLDGVLIVDDEELHPGDYRRGDAHAIDHRVWSQTGCSCVLITSYRDVIL